ncbi:MAG: serine/threonine protein kinase [Deltaproteobacteria bacterium]|nr:serine/threonine protein kinase [Deltaproteobacteria bacterium]
MIGASLSHLTIKKELGHGAMGSVYFAEHEVLRTPRAVKVLLPRWTRSDASVQRFVDEARAAASIRHRSIIGVHDCGQLPDGCWYIVMDFLDGGTLTGFCASHGPLSPHLALQILAPAANGLEAAHAANIVHRNLKPDNIYLIEREDNPYHPVILDFGIAKLGEDDGGARAHAPLYMAPEQMRDLRIVDRRSDVYALAVIAYQMLTGGWFPYERRGAKREPAAASAAELYRRQLSEPPVDPRERFATVPERWASAILTALHPDPARRPQTARAFALMLAEATPGDAYFPAGTDLVRSYARELLDIGNLLETVRASRPSLRSSSSRYHLGARLGAGGMAEVYSGTMIGAEGFARPVAIKRVLPGFAAVPQFAAMFVQEAQLAARLSHPNVVQVLDFDRDEEGRLFLVMEYVDGRELAALAQTGRLPISAIIFIVSEMLAALAHAHELPAGGGGGIRGLVHRDVSPQNVLLSWEGAVKVSDFGIAKAREASVASASLQIKGKPSYMSPEQARGEELDGRSDLFAVGVVLWELLAGRRLFDGTTQEVIAQLLFRDIPAPRRFRPDTPPELEAITMRLLQHERDARHADAFAAIDDLARCADAPRNGRLELQRLLADRFPAAGGTRRSRPRLVVGDAVPTRPTVADRPRAAVTAAWQTVRLDLQRPRPLPLALLALAIAAATALIVAWLGSRAERWIDDRDPDEAQLTITTSPTGAHVSVDGRARGASPVTGAFPRGAELVIDVESDGFMAARRAIVLDAEVRTLHITLAPRP